MGQELQAGLPFTDGCSGQAEAQPDTGIHRHRHGGDHQGHPGASVPLEAAGGPGRHRPAEHHLPGMAVAEPHTCRCGNRPYMPPPGGRVLSYEERHPYALYPPSDGNSGDSRTLLPCRSFQGRTRGAGEMVHGVRGRDTGINQCVRNGSGQERHQDRHTPQGARRI